MRRVTRQTANYRNSITYRHTLTKDNKQDSNETGNKYTRNKTLNQRNKNNVVGKST
jgi:hypothetical protein